jgi:hypothetical protein
MRACNVDLDNCAADLVEYIDTELDNLVTDGGRGLQADRRLPARHPARRHPRAVVGPRGGDRRQRARRDLRRAREPRRLFPAGAGHDPLRRGQLHQPRHRQAAGMSERAPRPRRRRGGGARSRSARRTSKKKADALEAYCVNLNEKAKKGKIDPLIGREAEISAPSRCSAAGRRTTRSTSAIPASARRRSPKASPSASSKATCRRCCRRRRSSRSTWARCSPARAIAATSRSG